MLIFGEVYTALLQNSISVSRDAGVRLLAGSRAGRVRRSDRPIAYAISPDRLQGVDCRLPGTRKGGVRAIGTVRHRTMLTGGHVVQGSAFARIERSETTRRLAWSHYLARPGSVEVIGRVDWHDLASGFINTEPSGETFDPGSIGARAVDLVQQDSSLDRRPALRAARTHLRWVVHGGGEETKVEFWVSDEGLRTLQLSCPVDDVMALVEFCEDIALHDWLLSTLLVVMEKGQPTSRAESAIARLRPAVDHLCHLWMPAARLSDSVAPLWKTLDRRPGFTRQWEASVARIRDQLFVRTITLLEGQSVRGKLS